MENSYIPQSNGLVNTSFVIPAFEKQCQDHSYIPQVLELLEKERKRMVSEIPASTVSQMLYEIEVLKKKIEATINSDEA